MKNTLLLAALASIFTVSTLTQAQTAPTASPKREMRGVWISTHLSLDWPNRTQTPAQQRAALLTILDHNKATGMNAAFLQVRSQSDAMYPSALEPWSYYLTNSQGSAPAPAWDPLQFAIDESRKRGLEFHAWINPYRAVATATSAGNTTQYAANHVSRTHPEWMLTVGNVMILNPGLPAVREHVTNVIMDIVNRYDVDGIHFDDYFYPTPGTINDDAAFAADPRGFAATAAGRADWRRDNVNLLIAGVNERIQAVKPWVKFGISPSGIYRSASSAEPGGSPTSTGANQHYLHNFADSRKWLQQGWVDYLAPQVYWYIGQTGSDYKLLVPWWNQNAFGRHMYIGIADYKMTMLGWTDPKQVANQIALNRANGNIGGQIHFRHDFLRQNLLGYRTDLMQNVYNRPALLPTMPWKGTLAPAAPTGLAAAPGKDVVGLSWAAAPDTREEMEKVRRFAVYRSETRAFDVEAADNLIGVTEAATPSFADTKAAGKYYYYAVTALNRLSTESAISNLVSNDVEAPAVRTRDVSVTLAGGTASIQAADIDGGTTDNWGIDSLTASPTSFSCADIGAKQVTLSALDKAGLTSSGTATVTVLGRVPQPAIAVSRLDSTPTGAPANTIVLGYGAQSLALAASDADSATGFAWNPAAGLSSTGALANFAPTGAGTFTLTAQAISVNGCPAVASVTVPVIDARCGDGKVAVCHKPGKAAGNASAMCVAPDAVPAFLRKGDTLGACAQ